MKVTVYLFIFLLTIQLVSCVKTFAPDLSKYDELLVVDGEITNTPGPYVVKLSLSARPQETPKFKPYSNCKVEITDNLGNRFNLHESGYGVYKTDSLDLTGVVGRSYKLSIVTPDHELYESNMEMIQEPLKIKSLYAEFQHKDEDPKDYFFSRDGYQFYLDTEPSSTTDNFLFWKLQCTYKFNADLPIRYYYDGKIQNVLHMDTLNTCYRTESIPDYFLMNTNTTGQSEVTRFPLHFVDNYTKALTIRYSLKAVQYRLGRGAFEYWSAVKKIRDAGGNIYTAQPYQIKNNLMNKTHPEKNALGYFTVGGTDEKRIFVNHPIMSNRHEVCVLPPPQTGLMMLLARYPPEALPVFLPGNLSLPDQECLDCRRRGVLEKPNFWID